MNIDKYLNQLSTRGKHHSLLVMTPKNEYPNQFDKEYIYNLVKSVLKDPKGYIGIYNDEEEELMQYVAFKLFLEKVICDNEVLHNGTIEKVKRLDKDGVISFFIVKEFFNTVPYGEKSEEEAIKDGKIKGLNFVSKYPLNKFEYANPILTKDSDAANIFIKIEFTNKGNNYLLDYAYIR